MKCMSQLLSLSTIDGLNAWAGQTDLPASVTWVGPTDGEFSWLIKRIELCFESVGSVLVIDSLDSPYGEGLYERFALTQTDRLIVACRNRWDYPAHSMRRLAADRCDVPLALVTSDWWSGWSRTGAGHLQILPHLVLPWYRWWDGWAAWLSGRYCQMHGPFPNLLSGIRTASQLPADDGRPANSDRTQKRTESLSCKKNESTAASGLVLADCSITAQSWNLSFGGVATRTQDFLKHPHDHQEAVSEQLDWIIWDDSCLCTSQGHDQASRRAIEQLRTLLHRHPSARLWLGLTQPRWHDVVGYQQANLDFDLLVKPFYGFLL